MSVNRRGVFIKETGKGVAKILEDLKYLIKSDVLVGIPQANEEREGITNAQLLFVHSEGSPAKGIPARPVIQIAVKENKERIGKMMGAAIKAGLEKKDARAKLERTGLFVVNKVRNVFGSDELTPLKEATKKRKAKKITKSKRGKTVAELQTELLTGKGNPLIDTGELRKSITYVVRGK